MFTYATGTSAANYAAPEGYLPAFAAFESLSANVIDEIYNTCGQDDKVSWNTWAIYFKYYWY